MISNGVLNLAVDKRKAVQEIYRVLVPGGRLHLADVFLGKELKESERLDANLWAGCVAGALLEQEIIEIAKDGGIPGLPHRRTLRLFPGISRRENGLFVGGSPWGKLFSRRK